MPRRELARPRQVVEWLEEWGRALSSDGSLVLIGSGGLLWHAHEKGIEIPLPERSMDVDPVTEDEAVARLGYDAQIGSEFELDHGWHVNLMPVEALRELPAGWEGRATRKAYGRLTVTVPAPEDLLAPKLRWGSRGTSSTPSGPAAWDCCERGDDAVLYVNYDDLARLRYGRLLWRNAELRDRLVRHWTDFRHPYRDRYIEGRAVIEEVLESAEADGELDRQLRERGTSLRGVIREIPPVFGSFWRDAGSGVP